MTTAEGICSESSQQVPEQMDGPVLAPMLTPYLREQHFGSLEGAKWRTVSGQQSYRGTETGPTTVTPVSPETEASMTARANSFVSEYLLPVLLDDPSDDETVAVVAHGIILRVLWKCIASLFNPQDIRLKPDVEFRSSRPGAPLAPVWSNTGFMELYIQRHLPRELLTLSTSPTPSREMLNGRTFVQPQAPERLAVDAPLSNWTLDVLGVDSRSHLADVHRTRGGIGSAMHDERQQKIDSFFEK